MKKGFKQLFIFLMLSALQFDLNAGTADPAYKLKAVFIFNFTKFIEWPPSTFSSSESPFIIGVYGNNQFGTYLEEAVSGEKVGTHPIKVRYINDKSEISSCHMLYISETLEYKEINILAAALRYNVLTIGEGETFNKNGGIIRFYNVQNKIRLSIHNELLKSSGLTVSSKLLSLATLYTDR
jgi:hypothetical protein